MEQPITIGQEKNTDEDTEESLAHVRSRAARLHDAKARRARGRRKTIIGRDEVEIVVQ